MIRQGLEDGRVRDLLALTSEDFQMADIGARLARINRYAGATKWPYSVATHSVLVSYLAEPWFARAGLLHDIPEAFGIGDLIAPIKRLEGFESYRKLEDQLIAQLVPAFPALALNKCDAVRWADERAYQLECLYLCGKWPEDPHTRWTPSTPTWREHELATFFLSAEFSWRDSRDTFMARYRELRQA